MNTRTYLLSTDDLKKESTIDLNVEDNLLESSILNAQNIDIQAIIGTKLYEEIIRLVETDEITGSTQEIIDIRELTFDWIYYTHVNYTLYRCLPFIATSFRNIGLVNNSSDSSTPISKEVYNSLKNNIENDVDYYANKLKDYLCDFFDKYPDYVCNTDKSYYNTQNQSKEYFSGIYIKRKNRPNNTNSYRDSRKNY